jgi:hypothetical protein
MSSSLEVKEHDSSTQTAAQDSADVPYCYSDSGIQERHGHVPLWLWAVVVGLTVWAVYYTITYWSPTP